MFAKLDYLNQPPQLYILQQRSNKTTFGGVLFSIFILVMISISLSYLFGYFLNEKYQIEYSRFYSPITNEQRDHLNSDPELNPNLNFELDGRRYININKTYNDNFAFYDETTKRFYYKIDDITINKNVSSLSLSLIYRCRNFSDKICALRDEDKEISSYGEYLAFYFYYPSFILDHSKAGDPFDRNHTSSASYIFDFKNPTQYSLEWKVIKYKDEKGIYDLFDWIKGEKRNILQGILMK